MELFNSIVELFPKRDVIKLMLNNPVMNNPVMNNPVMDVDPELRVQVSPSIV